MRRSSRSLPPRAKKGPYQLVAVGVKEDEIAHRVLRFVHERVKLPRSRIPYTTHLGEKRHGAGHADLAHAHYSHLAQLCHLVGRCRLWRPDLILANNCFHHYYYYYFYEKGGYFEVSLFIQCYGRIN